MVQRTYCPDGRRIYRWSDKTGDLAEGRVATRAELARQRRRPAPGQEPVGSLWAVRRYVPLYRVADTQELPPMSPKRLANWTALRTCVRCALQRNHPWPARDSDGLRVCWGCREAEQDNEVQASRNVDRARAEREALALLSDPDIVILDVDRVCDTIPTQPRVSAVQVRVCAVDPAGTVLVDHTYTNVPRGSVWPAAAVAELTAALAPLAGRRLVMWRWQWLSNLTSAVTAAAMNAEEVAHYDAHGWVRTPSGPVTDLGRSLEVDSQLGGIVARWRPIQTQTFPARDDHQAYSALFGVPPELPAAMHLAVLRAVAGGRHPAGPARCPYRPDRVTAACHRTDLTAAGLCPKHSPALEGIPS